MAGADPPARRPMRRLPVLAMVLTACSSSGDEVRVTLVADLPAGTPEVYLASNLPEFGPWAPDGIVMEGDDTRRSVEVIVPRGTRVEYKFTLGSWDREALGPSGTVMPNFVLEVLDDTTVSHDIVDFRKDASEYMADVAGSGVLGTLVYWPDVASDHLEPTRHVEVWLPPGYDDEPERHYPVVYMSDGQNLFDPRIANTGTDWGVDEAMVAGVEAGAFPPAVVVGVWSSDRRVEEYSPWHEADRYARFLIDELMPRVAAEYRVRTGPEHTFHMGSSMGGLLSWYLVSRHPDHFSACGCLSTHFILSPAVEHSIRGGDPGRADTVPFIVGEIEEGAAPPQDTRYFFDHGTEGLDARYGPVHARVEKWLREQGLEEGREYAMKVYEGADHNEASWRSRVGDQLRWLLAGEAPGG